VQQWQTERDNFTYGGVNDKASVYNYTQVCITIFEDRIEWCILNWIYIEYTQMFSIFISESMFSSVGWQIKYM